MPLFGKSKNTDPPDKTPQQHQDVDMNDDSSQKSNSKRNRTKSASSDISFATATSIATQNSFSDLEDGVDGPNVVIYKGSSNAKRAKKENPSKDSKNVIPGGNKREHLPPPITVKKLNIESLNSSLKDMSVPKESITIKLTHYGIKLFADSNQNFQILKDTLTDKDIEFFTHQLKEERLSKFVLYGLPNYSVNDVKDELIAKSLKPVEVKTLNIKTSRYDSHTNYIVYFKKSDRIKPVR